MRRIHGWTSIATVAALALGGAAAAAPAEAAKRPARRQAQKPALATGKSRYPAATWRLEGRRLTVRLRDALVSTDEPGAVDVAVRCGDSLSNWEPVFAEGTERRLRVAGETRELSAVLPRDVAARANYCAFEIPPDGPAAGTVNGEATMRLRRGTAPGCRPGRSERVVHRRANLIVTHVNADREDGVGWADGYRFCRLPGGSLKTLDVLYSGGGGGGGSYSGTRFASAGSWLAWSTDYVSHTRGSEWTSVRLRDLRSSVRTSPTAFVTRPGTFAATTALTVAPDGTAAWVRRQNRTVDDHVDVTQEVQVGWPHGRVETLDRWSGPLADEPAHALTDPAISADGRTVTWRNAGQARSATLPPAIPDDPSASTAVATGASSDPAARFRLTGSDLTVVLDRRLTPRGFRGRPSVRVVCGDSAKDPTTIRSLDWMLLAAKAERSLRVGAGDRIVRARLDANVAARANWCAMSWRSRAGNRYLNAPMGLRQGTPASCAATPREQVVRDTDQLLVTEVLSRPTDRDSRESALHACDKANRVRTPLGTSGSSYSDGYRTGLAATGGTWVATIESAWDKYQTQSPCSLTLRDAGTRGSRPIPVWRTPSEEVDAWICAEEVALAPSGALAWIATPRAEPGTAPVPDDRLHARTLDGRVVTITTGPTRSLTGLTISADGTTVTWHEAGAPRSARFS